MYVYVCVCVCVCVGVCVLFGPVKPELGEMGVWFTSETQNRMEINL